MLVLSRKTKESIVINGNITIEVLQVKGKGVRLGIKAPAEVRVLRGELQAFDQMESASTIQNTNSRLALPMSA
jgi:carbon storage regulator CsrA